MDEGKTVAVEDGPQEQGDRPPAGEVHLGGNDRYGHQEERSVPRKELGPYRWVARSEAPPELPVGQTASVLQGISRDPGNIEREVVGHGRDYRSPNGLRNRTWRVLPLLSAFSNLGQPLRVLRGITADDLRGGLGGPSA